MNKLLFSNTGKWTQNKILMGLSFQEKKQKNAETFIFLTLLICQSAPSHYETLHQRLFEVSAEAQTILPNILCRFSLQPSSSCAFLPHSFTGSCTFWGYLLLPVLSVGRRGTYWWCAAASRSMLRISPVDLQVLRLVCELPRASCLGANNAV